MDYDFGDILDARNAPGISNEGHFILVVGETSKGGQTEVMYYTITSRVYAVFKGILAFFNNCLARGDKYFLRYFSKEKGKKNITPHGFLSQAVFLDKDTNYPLYLDVDSTVVINSAPKLIDKAALETLRRDGKVVCRSRLAKLDAFNLNQTIKCSNDVSPDRKSKIACCFNKIKATLR